jgi:hypothetical protein
MIDLPPVGNGGEFLGFMKLAKRWEESIVGAGEVFVEQQR